MHRVQSEFGASETGNARSFADDFPCSDVRGLHLRHLRPIERNLLPRHLQKPQPEL